MSDTPTPAYVISTSISEWASDWQGEPYSYIQIAQEAIDALAAAGYRVVPVPDEDPHLIQFRDDGWTIAHPIAERIDLDSLFDCQVRWEGDDPGVRGVYELLDSETIGARFVPGRDAQ